MKGWFNKELMGPTWVYRMLKQSGLAVKEIRV